MQMSVSLLALCVVFILLHLTCAQKSSYDHQTTVYSVRFKPVTVESKQIEITPYFSPEHSTDTLVELIESATSSIDIASPGFSSWSGCTPYTSHSDPCMTACTPAKQREEAFPIFTALLNAAHKGIKVRVLTNNYGTLDCVGTISPLPFLALNGIEVAYFASVTFMHAKYMCIDGKTASVSSINFSKTSFLRNREAGAIINGTGALPLVAFTQKVFEADWMEGTKLKPEPSKWNAAQLKVIQDKTRIATQLPKPSASWASYYVTAKPAPIGGDMKVTIDASPDYANSELFSLLDTAQQSLDIMVYQVTDAEVVEKIVQLSNKGVKVRLLVSSSIYGSADCALANEAYANITKQASVSTTTLPVEIRKTTFHYTYSHQKFWIVDGKTVCWSTGNLSPTDIPDASTTKFPPYGEAGWVKANRDFSVCVRENREVVARFQQVFDADRDPLDKFPSKVYPWTTKYEVKCGTGFQRQIISGLAGSDHKRPTYGSNSTDSDSDPVTASSAVYSDDGNLVAASLAAEF
jgi:phosphatidylserine/phosphatidylglycerophosphate/cardiolipin synthase-like enzyme